MGGIDDWGRVGDVPGYLSEVLADGGGEVPLLVGLEGFSRTDMERQDAMVDGVSVWRAPGMATVVLVEEGLYPGTRGGFGERPTCGIRGLVFDRGDVEFASKVTESMARWAHCGAVRPTLDVGELVRDVGRVPVSDGRVDFDGNRYVWGAESTGDMQSLGALCGRDNEVMWAVRRACIQPGLDYLAGRRSIEVPYGVESDVEATVAFRDGAHVLDVEGEFGTQSFDVDVPATFAKVGGEGVSISSMPPDGSMMRPPVRPGTRVEVDMRDLGVEDVHEMESLARGQSYAVRQAPTFEGRVALDSPAYGMRMFG